MNIQTIDSQFLEERYNEPATLWDTINMNRLEVCDGWDRRACEVGCEEPTNDALKSLHNAARYPASFWVHAGFRLGWALDVLPLPTLLLRTTPAASATTDWNRATCTNIAHSASPFNNPKSASVAAGKGGHLRAPSVLAVLLYRRNRVEMRAAL